MWVTESGRQGRGHCLTNAREREIIMTDTEKMLALVVIMAKGMNQHQLDEAMAAWRKLVADKKPDKATVFLGWGEDDGDD
jgi:hypothetical protein